MTWAYFLENGILQKCQECVMIFHKEYASDGYQLTLGLWYQYILYQFKSFPQFSFDPFVMISRIGSWLKFSSFASYQGL